MQIVNQSSKSILARLLATENITVQHRADAKTAWFDVKNRILCLPIWREITEDLYDMLVVHEVGHALDTPPDDWMDALNGIASRVTGSASPRNIMSVKNFMNVIEDARIDKRQKRRFPGSRRNYLNGYKELIERDFFGTNGRDINSYPFIDRANMYFKGGAAFLDIKFSNEERVLIRRMENAETFDDVIALTEEIFSYSYKKKEESKTDRHKDGYEESDDDSEEFDDYEESDSDDDSEFGDSDETDETDDTDDFDDESDDTDSSDNDADDGDNSEDEDEDEDSESSGKTTDVGGEFEDDDVPDSETEKSWQSKQNDLVLNSDTEYHYVKLPKYDTKKIIDDYKIVLAAQNRAWSNSGHSQSWFDANREELQRFRNDENASISFMVKEFEMRKSADEYSRTSTAKTGVIDTNKLFSYKYNDDLFRRVTTVASGKSHGFVMFIDWSGSMHPNLRNTIKQLMSLTLFCKRVQIPFEVYAFRSCIYGEDEGYLDVSDKTLQMQSFRLRNILSSRMKLHELNNSMHNLWCMAQMWNAADPMHSTPLNSAIMVASDVVNEFKARTGVQIVNTIFLTDGQSDPVHGVNGINYVKKDNKFILEDHVTKKTYEIPMNQRYSKSMTTTFNSVDNRGITSTLLKILKDRTGCNLIGFYIFEYTSPKRAYESFFGYTSFNQEFYQKMTKSFSDDGFMPVTSAGYDEYYILNRAKMNVVQANLKVDSDMTKARIAKAFMKFNDAKSINRVLLKKFIAKIAA